MDALSQTLQDPAPGAARLRSAQPYLVQWLILVMGILIVGGLAGYGLLRDRTDLEHRERERLRTQARVIRENLGQQLSATNRVLEGMARDLPQLEPDKKRLAAFNLRLAMLKDAMPGVRTLVLIDATGTVRASSRESLIGFDSSQRKFFQQVRDHPDSATVYFSPPYRTALGIWGVNLSRMIPGPRGEFAGVISATLDPDYFRTLMASVQYAPDMWVAMAHSSGVQILMVPDREGQTGKNLAQPGSFFSRHMDSGREDNVFTGVVYATGEERMMALRNIAPKDSRIDGAMVVAVGRNLDTFYAPWKRDLILQSTVLLLLALGAVLALTAYQARARRFDASIQQAQAAVLRAKANFELLLNSAGEGIYGVDLAGLTTFINPAALRMLGYERDEVLGKNQHLLFHPTHADGNLYPARDCPVFLTLADGMRREVEDDFVRKGGETFPVHLTVTPILENGLLVGAEAVFQDVTGRKETERELLRLATTDPLTGSANRRRFMEQLEAELARIKRFGGQSAFLMLDLDLFKQVNDTFGHAAGDAVLRHFVHLAESRLRRVDLVGRLGGEEFGILLPSTDLSGATEFAEEFRQQVADHPVMIGNDRICYTVSIGVAEFDERDPGPDEILARADGALYLAKERGRNRVEQGPR